MKKRLLLWILLFICFPLLEVNAEDYELKNGKVKSGTYAQGEDVYHFYKIKPSKDGYIAITATTSNKKELIIDICDSNKNVIASEISIGHKKTVLHKVKKKNNYYLRIKGTPDVKYKISYKMKTLDALTYAKKYTYTFTNASFNNSRNAILLKVKGNSSGNLHFMCETGKKEPIMVQYLNSKKKSISNSKFLVKNSLSGVGVRADKIYYIKLWNANKSTIGTTTILDMKYQIDDVMVSTNNSRGKSYTLSQNTYKESLVVADQKNTYWYKVKLPKDQKLSISIESRMLQMNGSCLEVDLYNRDGVKMTTKSIKISEECNVEYKKKKYNMIYPVKKIETGKIISDTYYIKVVSNSKKSSGSYRIKWN